MTREEKQLLLKDLCARLPYGVKVQVADYKIPVELSHINTKNGNGRKPYCFVFAFEPERVKPYLRPMSSMTKDEREEFNHLYYDVPVVRDRGNTYRDAKVLEWMHIDWYNTHHFDYRGLIEKGLAIEAPKGMYK